MSRRKSGADKASPAAARKPRKQADPRRPRRGPGDSTESPGGANECEKSVETESPQTIPGRNGGTLYPSEAGSNKGVHRGPDLGIRRNVMEGMLMRALIRDGLLLVVVKSRRPEFRTTAEDSRQLRPPRLPGEPREPHAEEQERARLRHGDRADCEVHRDAGHDRARVGQFKVQMDPRTLGDGLEQGGRDDVNQGEPP